MGTYHHAVQAQVSESDVKAAFIERFTRFVEWPEDFDDETFTIAVIGKNTLDASLDNVFADIKVKNVEVKIIYTDDISDLEYANLVFIARTEKRRLNEILAVIGHQPILIISDTKDFCAMGTCINMYVDGSHIRYEINETAIKNTGLKVSSLLLNSAKNIKTNE